MSKLALLGGSPVRTKPFQRWPQSGPEEEAALIEVLRSGKWFENSGDKAKTFEKAFAEAQDAKFGTTTNSGTMALWLAMHAAGIRPGDEVILPTYTFVASATAILLAGAVPIFADVVEDTFNIDPKSVEAVITPRTKAILAVHFAGYPADLAALEPIAQRHGLMIIEDAAHAHGSVYRGRKLGAQGKAGAFSFQESKNITAGEGGIVLTNDEEIRNTCYGAKMYGRILGSNVWYGHARFGGNFRMTEFQAAILLVQLARLEEQTQRRWENGRILQAGLAGIPGMHPQTSNDPLVTRRAYHLSMWRYVAEEVDGLSRDRFFDAIRAEGVYAWGGYGMPLHKQPLFTERERLGAECPTACLYNGQVPDYAAVETPVAAKICAEQAVWMGHSTLLGPPEDMQDILNAVEKVVENRHELLVPASAKA